MINWISVKDQLPDEDNEYLIAAICSKEGGAFSTVATFQKDDGWIRMQRAYDYADDSNYGFEDHGCEVTYWAHLPEPPDENLQ